MELIFQEKQVQYLNRIVNETVLLEQTADLIVPDSIADIDRVVDAYGTAMLRSQECNAQGLSADGTVRAGVLFVDTDGAVQCISAQIPFTVRRELASPQEDCTLQCKCVLRSVDARALNSRKLLVRVGIACTVTAYAQEKCMCYDLPEAAPNLQLKRTELPFTMPLALGEKSFVLNEELEVPSGKPSVERLLKCVFRPQTEEEKIVGDKAVFKGNLLLHALYESADGKLVCCEWNVPFSQYAQLMRELDEGEIRTHLCITNADVEQDTQSDCRRLLLSASLLAQCTAYGEQKISMIADAFCTDAVLTPQYQSCEMLGILDRQTFRETAMAASVEPAQSVVDAWIYPEQVNRRREDGRVRLELPMNCNVLYYDEHGALQGKTLRPTVNAETALSEQANCMVEHIDSGEIYCSAGPDGLQLRAPVTMQVECSANHRLNAVSGGEITDLPATQERRPSVILRRTDNDEELWALAKSFRTPLQTIIEANALQGDTVPADTMLLIPL